MGMICYEFMNDEDEWNVSDKEEYFWVVDEKLLTVKKLHLAKLECNISDLNGRVYYTDDPLGLYKKIICADIHGNQYTLGEDAFKTKDEAITRLLEHIQDQIEVLDNRIDQLEILRDRAENSKDDNKEISNLNIFQYRVFNPDCEYFESDD